MENLAYLERAASGAKSHGSLSNASVLNLEIVLVIDNEFIVDKTISRRTAIRFSEFVANTPDDPIVIAVGDASSRNRMANLCKSAGLTFGKLIHPNIRLSSSSIVGDGSIRCEGVVVTTNVTIGRHVYINVGCTISHDCILGDFSTLSPGAHIVGWVEVGKRVFFGTGANARNGTPERRLLIADVATVGAGA